MNDILTCDAVELSRLVASGYLSASEAVQAALRRLEEIEPSINAFSALMADDALEQARRADKIRATGAPLPPLFGVPISVKDLISVAGAPLQFGSRIFADNVAVEDAPSVQRLRAAGAIIIGKTTTSELGCKAVGQSPLTGNTRSPWDLSKTAGGSSAGAAASVAAGVTPVALGTDGGGSIRIPASLNGLVGIKAQFGRVPVYPRSATPDLAHVAPLSRTVRDAALMLSVVAGHDARDPASLFQPVPDFLKEAGTGPRRARIAWSADFGYAKPDPEVVEVAESAMRAFEAWGCKVSEVRHPVGSDPADAWTLQFYGNIALRLSQEANARSLIDPSILPLVEAAEREPTLAYCRAMSVQRDVKEHLRALFTRYDFLASPTLPVASVPVGVDVPPGQEARNLVTWASYTYPFNLSGHPAISLPAGLTSSGHPVGLQIVGRPLSEGDLINLAAAYEAVRPWRYPQFNMPRQSTEYDSQDTRARPT